MARLATNSDDPPKVLSKRNLAASSVFMRCILRWTVSSVLMVVKFISSTTSS